MPADDDFSEESTDANTDDDEFGDRLTLEQELGVANVLLAIKENRIADAGTIAKSLPREIASLAPSTETAQREEGIFLKDLQLAQIQNPSAAQEDCQPARNISGKLARLAGKIDLSDDDEGGEGLVEAAEAAAAPEAAASSQFDEVTKLLAKAIGDETEEDKFLQKFFCERLWKGDPTSGSSAAGKPAFIATSEFAVEGGDPSSSEVIVCELEEDLSELRKANAHEAKFNFRHEAGAKNAITGSHDREAGTMFDVVNAPSKRALKSREKLAEKKLKAQAAKELLLADQPELPLVSPSDLQADENFPSDQEWFLCDGCSTPILPNKVMFVCKSGCPDYALCKSCQKNKVRHDHPLTRAKCPPTAQPPKTWKLAVNPDAGAAEPGKLMAAQILREITFVPDQNYKYITCDPNEEKLSLEEILKSVEEGAEGLEGPEAEVEAGAPAGGLRKQRRVLSS